MSTSRLAFAGSLAALFLGGLGVARGEGEASLPPLHWSAPVYSEAAWRARIAGRVELELVVGPSGSIAETTVTRRLPMGLDQAAERAVSGWSFAASAESRRRVRVAIQFVIDPADAWEDGAEWTDDGALRVWRVHRRHVLRRGLLEGTPLALDSEEAQAAIATVVRQRATNPYGKPQLVWIGSARPSRAFMRRLHDIRTRVWRHGIAVHLGAEPMNVERVCRSPRGPVIVEVLSRLLEHRLADLYAVAPAPEMRIVDADLEDRPIICGNTISPHVTRIDPRVYRGAPIWSSRALATTALVRSPPQPW